MFADDRPHDLKTLAAALVLVTLTGCRATARATVSVRGDGGGSVAVHLTLDQEATDRIGHLDQLLRVGDLQKQGWVLDSSTPSTATIHHPFRGAAEGSALLAELGPVHLTISAHRALISDTMVLQGDIDLRAGVDAFADQKLVDAMGTPSLAGALGALRQQGATVPEVDVSVETSVLGHDHEWAAPLGQDVRIAVRTTRTDTVALEWFVAAAGLLLAALVTGGVQVRRAIRRRHHDTWDLPRP